MHFYLLYIVEDKNNIEHIINNLNKEIYNIKLVNKMNRIKGTSHNYGFNYDNGNNKRNILDHELVKLKKLLAGIDEELRKTNMVLLEKVRICYKEYIIIYLYDL